MNVDSPAAIERPTTAESAQVVLHAAQLAATGLPLGEGLLAASQEVGSGRMSRALRKLGAAKNLTTDVQLAAHAIENQALLCSNDSDFARFQGLRWANPLAEP